MRHYVTIALLLLIGGLLPATAEETHTLTRGIPYVEDGHERQTLDIYLPTSTVDAPFPVIFMVHGGGFFFGDSSSVQAIAERYADRGYAVIAPNYRLYPDAMFPDSHADVFCAMAWVFDHAQDYTLDMSQIILLGESAGANITAYLGAVDDASTFTRDCDYAYPENPDYDAVISLYMPVDLLSCDCTIARRMASLYTGISYLDWENDNAIDDYFDFSVISWLDEDDPPFYLLHGAIDFLVPVSEAELFVERFEAVGGTVDLVIFDDANHGFVTSSPSPLLTRSYQVIDEWISAVSS